ncbi:MAG: hypothetical protein A2157_15075 [Deltaproteobacteria bacterium RBG_16_47_11]|nr:MAG: hypothetical protein A2157_15075 [Deltaproteobacteria bacterium RBG_16_47_11]
MKTLYLTKIIMIALLLGLVCSQVAAHETDIVHPGLTDNAVFALNNELINTYKIYIRDGSIHEDKETRWKYHGYDPVTDSGWVWGSGKALDRAADLWNQALSAYGQGRLIEEDGAFHLLGRVAHLIEDMTSPPHTHVDIHVVGDDFENWGRSNFSQISGLLPEIPGDGSIAAFISNLASFTYYKSAWFGVIEARVGTQPASPFQSMFPSLHWSNGGWLGHGWVIDNIGYFDNTLNSNSWWPCIGNYTEDNFGMGGVRRIQGYFYIENAGGDDRSLTPTTWEGSPNSKTLLRVWGDILYPKCVSYIEGLFKKFAEYISNVHSPDRDN